MWGTAIPLEFARVSPAQPIQRYVLTPHALREAARRGILLSVIADVLARPEQRQTVRPGRVVLQARRATGWPKKVYLVRVIVDIDREPAEVVTVYRTSRIAKYWESES